MDRARFEALVEAFGAQEARWPAADRDAARAFAATPEAVAILKAARALDGALDLDVDAAPASLPRVRAILAAAPKAAEITWRAVAALAACALIGLTLGYESARRAPEDGAADAVIGEVFGDWAGG